MPKPTIRVDLREMKAFERKLKRLAKDAIPRAAVAAINQQARLVDIGGRRELRRMTLRNAYTERSLRLSPAKVRSSGQAGYAQVGSISPYLPIQETGGVVRARRRAIAIPTPWARAGRSKLGVVISRYRLRSGRKFFMLPTRSGKKMLVVREQRKLRWLRDISQRSIRIPARHWHTLPVKRFGTQAVAQQAYTNALRRELGKLGAK